MHLSCTDTDTGSKQTEARFHMTHVTYEFHRVRPQWFLNLWYIWHKPCTYLMSRLALCPNGLKQASNWASSPWSTIGCVQNDFWAYGTFGLNHAPMLPNTNNISERTEVRFEMTHVTSKFHQVHPKLFLSLMVHSAQTMYLSCIKISTISKWTRTSFHLTRPGVPSGASKTIFEPMVCLAQTIHLSCTDTNTISKWIEARFHMTHIN
jgi:hypothetical protein